MSLTFGAASSDVVSVAAASSINTLTSKSVCVWFYPTTVSDAQRIIAKGLDGSFNGWDLSFQPDGTLNWYTNRATSNSHVGTSTVITASKWWFCAATYQESGTTAQIYLGDLSLPATEHTASYQAGSGATASDSAMALTIGNNVSAAVPFLGRIYVTSLLNRVITLGEIRRLQEATRPKAEPNLREIVVPGTVMLIYPGANGTKAQPDMSGNRNHGTVTGATVSMDPPLLLYRDGLRTRRPQVFVPAASSVFFRPVGPSFAFAGVGGMAG